MKLHFNDVLVYYVYIGYLLCGHRVHLIQVLDKFDCAENVLEIELTFQHSALVIRLPPLLLFVLFHKAGYFVHTQRFPVLAVRTTFLSRFSTDVGSVEETTCGQEEGVI